VEEEDFWRLSKNETKELIRLHYNKGIRPPRLAFVVFKDSKFKADMAVFREYFLELVANKEC